MWLLLDTYLYKSNIVEYFSVFLKFGYPLIISSNLNEWLKEWGTLLLCSNYSMMFLGKEAICLDISPDQNYFWLGIYLLLNSLRNLNFHSNTKCVSWIQKYFEILIWMRFLIQRLGSCKGHCFVNFSLQCPNWWVCINVTDFRGKINLCIWF